MKKIQVLKNVFAANDQIADFIRNKLKEKDIKLINIMGSPGSGKTTFIEKTIEITNEKKFAVIEGDIETSIDAERLSRWNIPIYQINTGPFGGDCHLEASWIKSAIEEMNLEDVNIVLIENIGNLVCPAEFDTGAHRNVVVLSVTEGEDKPLKYPLMFRRSHYLIISKIDLLKYVDLNIDNLIENARKINPDIKVLKVSAKTGEGIEEWKREILNL
uniref:Hydrogenase accessory protein HypB n=1 Tax=candidate division WOR-3 bacterium TaxID=2052148 RepID=A0A7C4YGE0_UNCW3